MGSVKKNSRRVSIVINGLNSKKKRTFESKRLFNIVFRETALLSLFNDKKSVAKANVWLGKQPQVDLVAEKAFKKIISPLELNKTKIKIQWQDPISAPIAKGDKVGNIFIDIPGKELIKHNIVSSQSIDTMSTFMKAKSILMYLLYGEFVVK
jgi:D-alanyl-D-alanine carboxypeptidase (penicillin-binding protein 5/6)